jgi:hypothetical protein
LAFDKFYAPLQHSALLIMTTYLVAQFLIVGILELKKKVAFPFENATFYKL